MISGVYKFDKMVKGVKVKRLEYCHNNNWINACKANMIKADAVLTVNDVHGNQIILSELTDFKFNLWDKHYFMIVEEPEIVDKPTELEELLKQIKTSIEVTEDARKAYYAAKAKSLELSKLLQQKLSNPSN